MTQPLFPVRVGTTPDGGQKLLEIRPYRHQGAWVFDDPTAGLRREPFVSGVAEMIDRLVAKIPRADDGFRLLFSADPFDGFQAVLTLVRADPVEGHWYRLDGSGDEGWLCPALFCYFQSAPEKLYVRAGSP